MCKKHIPGEYQCSICGKRNVKLWWPEELERPFFVCADCCEKLQSPCYRFKKTGTNVHGHDKFEAEPTRMQPEWKINGEGCIPFYKQGVATEKMTSNLIINVSKYFPWAVFADEMKVVPVIWTNDPDEPWGSAGEDDKEWTSLPTR